MLSAESKLADVLDGGELVEGDSIDDRRGPLRRSSSSRAAASTRSWSAIVGSDFTYAEPLTFGVSGEMLVSSRQAIAKPFHHLFFPLI